MSEQRDFKKEWERVREQLAKTSQEAIKLVKRGEEELVKFSRRGKLHIDSTTLDLRRERIYYLIGKEYVQAKAPQQPTAALTKFLDELSKINEEQGTLRSKLKAIK